ncbi:uncharacterized protein LOC129598558 [Paramacrobiotus metropolitanus]|uniref:uncharacterized protein LOC129598558 n=1 Tax=Paramacrobiotus metropolitanus TaxID=2943436 RepID=UPI0024457491|nr:uncharacterized protein LOC129598558 [Paramacrobiotus metropolitanus]
MLRFYLDQLRYVGRPFVPKSSAFYDDLLFSLDESRFRQEMRMSRATFDAVLTRIIDHPIFKGNSNNSQAPVAKQLATALSRFGSCGNAASVGSVARKFGISEGTVDAFTKRVIVALVSLEKEVVRWPTTAEKRIIKHKIKSKHHFASCIGFVDGTDIVLATKPSMNGEDYFNRKKRYALSAMIVCDYSKRIIYTSCGFTGSAHDSRVYKSTDLYRNPRKYFKKDEYILADSAYAISSTVMPPYRKSEKRRNLANRRFNKQHSRARVRVEHCIGMLKNRFQCLKGCEI